MSDIALHIENLGKCYQIYDRPVDRLKQSLLRHRKRFYREFWALRDVSLTVKRGETLGIVGSNGSGKTTLLQMVCGTLRPTAGRIAVTGNIAALLELGAGFNPEFTGRENVYMNAAVMGLSRSEIDERFHDIAEFADIGDFINQPVKVYSSGMYVRLAFATAIHVSPDILVVDEALSVGDARFQRKCMAKIREFCERGTALFVTHSSTAVTELCTRAIWIENGRLQMDDTPKLVVEKYLQYMYEGVNAFSHPEVEVPENAAGNGDVDVSGFTPVDARIQQFGDRRVVIEGARIVSEGQKNCVAYAGKPCRISLVVKADDDIHAPLMGFIIRDHMGRDVLGDNTAFMKSDIPSFQTQRRYLISFDIASWPNFLEGDYSLTVAVADGTAYKHTQCHFIHDIVLFRSIPVRKPQALMSVPDTTVSCNAVE